jgi:alpha-N-arabinofuranosidase
MFTVHHDATLLPVELQSADYVVGTNAIPSVSVSASKDKTGAVHVTLCNLNPNQSVDVAAQLAGVKAGSIAGRVLTAPAMNAHNTFEQPEAVKPVVLLGAKLTAGGFAATLPAKSVVVLTLK